MHMTAVQPFEVLMQKEALVRYEPHMGDSYDRSSGRRVLKKSLLQKCNIDL